MRSATGTMGSFLSSFIKSATVALILYTGGDDENATVNRGADAGFAQRALTTERINHFQ